MSRKKRVLLVGEHPEAYTGNGNMMSACMDEIDTDKYDVCAFLENNIPTDLIPDPFTETSRLPFPIIHAYDPNDNDRWGKNRLLAFIQNHDIDILVFVGIDIWRYVEIFEHIKILQNKKGFTWKILAPYDLNHLRQDWIKWFNYPDQVFVYSKYGYNMLKNHVRSLYYHRPKFLFHSIYTPVDEKYKQMLRKQFFPDLNENTTIFGFVGVNQLRKNIINLLQGFSKIAKKRDDVVLYMHLNSNESRVNIGRLVEDFDIPDRALRTNNAAYRKLYPEEMLQIYRFMDCHIIPSFQEGLSWTVIESKLTGTPSILSNTTAHKDFIGKNTKDCGVIPISAKDTSHMTVVTEYGPSEISVDSCSPKAIHDAMLKYVNSDKKTKEHLSNAALKIGREWIENCNHFTVDLLDKEVEEKQIGEVL